MDFQNEWIFILDADEVVPEIGKEEINEIVSKPHYSSSGEEIVGYFVNRCFMFMGKWLQHAYYPNWVLRLFKYKHGRYEKLTDAPYASLDYDNEVHEPLIVNGAVANLQKAELLHYAFPSVSVFVDKHNKYSSWEANVYFDSPKLSKEASLQGTVGFRRLLKNLSRYMPMRPLMRFMYVYFWQKGFLDGKEGFYFAALHGFYEFLTSAKICELRLQGRK